jgi:hypothetical protein
MKSNFILGHFLTNVNPENSADFVVVGGDNRFLFLSVPDKDIKVYRRKR